MTNPTFFWHDYETFGKEARSDRPAQFAGIRTDLELNEISDPVMFYCKPSQDYLPDPEACLITGILPQTCAEKGLSEAEFAARINKELAQPGTIGVGYNSIKFDDEITRFLFWRNLIDPYARQYEQNDCYRWDLMKLAICAWSLRPNGIEWPLGDNDKTSFKLEKLTVVNGITHTGAHDALADVRATIALARKLKEANPKLWDFYLKLRAKSKVQEEIGKGSPFLHVSEMFGTDQGCIAPVYPLAVNPTNKNNGIILWDLRDDPAILQGLNVADIKLRLFTRTEDLPVGISRLPIKTIKTNAAPVVINNMNTLTSELAQRWNIDLEKMQTHVAKIKPIIQSTAALWSSVYQNPGPASDVDEDLYNGFIKEDRPLLDAIRAGKPVKKPFVDARLPELVFRYRARNFPETLNPAEQEKWKQHCHDRLLGSQDGVRNLETYREIIAEKKQEYAGNADKLAILDALLEWGKHIESLCKCPQHVICMQCKQPPKCLQQQNLRQTAESE